MQSVRELTSKEMPESLDERLASIARRDFDTSFSGRSAGGRGGEPGHALSPLRPVRDHIVHPWHARVVEVLKRERYRRAVRDQGVIGALARIGPVEVGCGAQDSHPIDI